MTKIYKFWSEKKDSTYSHDPTDHPIRSKNILGYMCKECKSNALFSSDFIYCRRYVYNKGADEFEFQRLAKKTGLLFQILWFFCGHFHFSPKTTGLQRIS